METIKQHTEPVLLLHKFVVLCFHNLHDATAIHTNCKEYKIDAAVIDHKFVLSFTQLTTALHRINNNNVNMSLLGQRQKLSTQPVARAVFVALSRTRNLDRILQSLPAGQQTESVIIVTECTTGSNSNSNNNNDKSKDKIDVKENAIELANKIRDIVYNTNPQAVEELLYSTSSKTTTSSILLPLPSQMQVKLRESNAKVNSSERSEEVVKAHVDEVALMSYYSITNSEVEDAMKGLICTNEGSSILRIKALEWCIVNKLVSCDV